LHEEMPSSSDGPIRYRDLSRTHLKAMMKKVRIDSLSSSNRHAARR
jgi:hypothetical protein